LHADTLVPPPGAWWRLHPDLAVNHAAGPRRSGTPTAAERGRLAAAAAADKFDELDEEAMAPLSWRSPAPTTTTVHSLFHTSFCGGIPAPPEKKRITISPIGSQIVCSASFFGLYGCCSW